MKLYLPLACVALLSIGIAPSVAADAAIEDLTEVSRSRSLTPGPIEIHSESEELPQQEPAIALEPQLSRTIQVKSPIARQKLETKQTEEDESHQPNPQLTQNISDNDFRQPHTQLTQNISDNDFGSTSIPNPPPVAALLSIPTTSIPKVDEIEQPSTSAQGLLRPSVRSFRGLDDTVQISQSVVQVTGVRLNPTATGLEVILEIPDGQVLQAETRIEGKSAIADIENAQLALPSGGEFSASSPDEGIASVTVTQLEGSRIRVSVTGVKAAPTSEVVKSDRGLVLGVTPSPQEDINITVTARQATPYRIPNASTATKTDTPLRDIPQSIQVIPEQVLEDQQVIRVGDALQNVSGVVNQEGGYQGFAELITIRGFVAGAYGGNYFRDGFRYNNFGFIESANLERIEVLKGPASILFGQAAPGGIINLVSKQPLREPYYSLEATAGNYDTYRGSIDISGPLNEDKTVLYRLNAFYSNSGSFRNFVEGERYFIAPVLSWAISPNTSLRIDAEFIDDSQTADLGIPVIGNEIADLPRSRFLGEPFSNYNNREYSIGYVFNHRFSDNWSVRNAFRAQWIMPERYYPLFSSLDEATGELSRDQYWAGGDYNLYFTQTDLTGRFTTGSIQHQLLAGVEYGKQNDTPEFRFGIPYASIDIFNPVYTRERYPKTPVFFRDDTVTTLGVYIQDQITLLPNLKLILGGRFDSFEQNRSEQNAGEQKQEFEQSDSAFSPRFGIVYQPIQEVSVYASYTTSFQPSFATFVNNDGSTFKPETGTQYEVGIKTDFLDGRLSTTLAAFYLQKQNVVTTDPNNPLFSIQTGEQTSQGVELDVVGQILPGWNIIASAAYIDARITEDNTLEVGNRLDNVAKTSASLWTSYEIQSGDLQGLGFGLGLLYLGDRQGDLANSFVLPSYLRTDAALYYRRDNWRAQLNVKNLFDTEYFSGSSYGDRLSVQPGAPLTVSGTFSIEF